MKHIKSTTTRPPLAEKDYINCVYKFDRKGVTEEDADRKCEKIWGDPV